MDIQEIVAVVQRVAPRARPEYMAALKSGAAVLDRYGVTTPLRVAHFLAQVLHETNGLTIVRESGAYSAARIMEIFGVGKHSAAITSAEAKKLAKNGPALFERVYGLGNPKKAAELGNTKPGDGWDFRGNGMMQTTGRGAHRRLGEKLGLGDLFERNPGAVTDAEHALLPALAEWDESGLNAFADRNDIRTITRRINGGFNGYADRVAWFNKVWPLLRDEKAPAESWKAAKTDAATKALQRDLAALGYGIEVDGRFGPATAKAVRDFQAKNGLVTDGIAGDVTLAAIKARLEAPKGAPVIKPADTTPVGTGPLVVGAASGGAAKSISDLAPTIQDTATQLAPHADVLPFLKVVVAVLGVAAVGLTLYGAAKVFLPGLMRKPLAVAQ